MLARGFVGSVGVISGSVGTTGYMNLAQLKSYIIMGGICLITQLHIKIYQHCQ